MHVICGGGLRFRSCQLVSSSSDSHRRCPPTSAVGLVASVIAEPRTATHSLAPSSLQLPCCRPIMFSHALSSSMRRAVPVAMRVPHMAPAPTSMPFLRTPLAFFSDSADLVTGTCKWFDSRKGFGFIVRDDGSGDVFVHQTRIHKDGFRSLAEGEPLEFKGEPRPPMPLSPIQPNARPRD
mmetsp:Transcript_15319/g.40478  ORF Transcript_15319/g.40478 Transcript_15319/m.40478 type:complete len:180 (-) Transcript_15319:164-703(-)